VTKGTKMKKRIYVEIPLRDKLEEFLNTEKIDIDVVTDQTCDIKTIQSDNKKESDLNTIYSGGWIACETARSLAKKMEISLNQMGTLLNQLNVKIRRCSLGCFK
jgi:hypothetical protein